MCVIHIGKVWFESRFESPSYMVPWMAESCRKWCLVFIGFAIKPVCRQCLKMRECSFLEGKLSLCGLPWKSGRWAGWVFLGRNVTSVWSSSYEHCWELSERCLSPWKVTPSSDIQRTSGAAWIGDKAIALVDVVGFLFKFPGSYHLCACQPDFQLPAPSFLYIRLFSSHDGSLVQLCGRSEVPGS